MSASLRSCWGSCSSGPLITLVMFPLLVTMYVRLARREEEAVRAEFGEEYDRYAAVTPAFIPRPRQAVPKHA